MEFSFISNHVSSLIVVQINHTSIVLLELVNTVREYNSTKICGIDH
jgi:hypothetical protein